LRFGPPGFMLSLMRTKQRPESKLQTLTLALDASVRKIDENGFLHVAVSNISKANVCPYYGWEMPGDNLDQDRVYMLLRAPEELAKAAPTANNLPLLSEHLPVDPDNIPHEAIVGATGTDAVFDAPYLKNSLVIYQREAIEGVQSSDKVELSCGYRYTLDLTPGEFEGVAYDGVMRDIVFNHVALVDAGRAGPDVLVADHLPEGIMKNKHKLDPKALEVAHAVHGFLRGKLAGDKAPSLGEVKALTSKVTADRFPKQREALAGVIKQQFGLTADADLEDLQDLLEEMQEGGDDDEEGLDADPLQALTSMLENRLSPEDFQAASELLGKIAPQADAKPAAPAAQAPNPAAPAAKPGEAPKAADTEEGMVDKKAMDRALATAEQRGAQLAMDRFKALRAAEEEVRPIIGTLSSPPDTPEAIYKLALDAAKVDLTGVPPQSYKHMVAMLKLSQRGAADDSAFDHGDGDELKELAQAIPGVDRLSSHRRA